MKTKAAFIHWTHPRHESSLLPIGIEYFPHIVRENDPAKEHWSIRFQITEENQKVRGPINLSMLLDNDMAFAYFDTLTSGTKFILLEGNTEVARGYIL